MKYLLQHIQDPDCHVRIGRYELITYTAGEEMVVRQDGSGLLSQCEPSTKAGLKRLLAWIDGQERHDRLTRETNN